ncbi:MAG TPA: hypothetical protein VFT42_03860 [Solirubrobacteraceae bacterium]|nr:hypothetical protein [Solirubrobacteraceae bacterium]
MRVPNVLVLRKVGPRADAILDAFQERMSLAARDGDTARIFTLEGAGHAVDPVPELDAIDRSWRDHVELATQTA